MTTNKKFSHLHVHTTYSLLDGISLRSDLIKKTKEYGMKGMAITEHGNMFNAISFYKECVDNNIVPIIGMEAYVAPDTRLGRSYAKKGEAEEDAKNGDLSMSAYHLTLLSKNREGYDNLKTLSTLAYREGFYRKPRIDDEILHRHKSGLIVLSGCLASKTSRLIVAGNKEKALEEIDKMRKIFGEDFYLEVMDHAIDEEKIVREALIEFGNQHGIGLVMTGDSHFTSHGHEVAHEAALCIGTNRTFSDPDRWKFNGEGYWYKSADEMYRIAERAGIPESALSNTHDIVNKIDDYGFKLVSKTKKSMIPLFRSDAGVAYTSDECHMLLDMKAWQGLSERGLAGNKEYEDRLRFELDTIKSKNFSSYFLIIADIIDYMRQQGILAPIGRGSSVGSLACYCLYITGLDPVKYGVPFSRFINAERKDLPDIDTDISQERRKDVIDYIVKKYGEDRVAHIVTFQSMGAKGVIDNVGRVLGVPHAIRKQVSKLLGDHVTKDDTISELLEHNQPARELMEKTPQWIDISNVLEGNNKNLGAHAAGIVISNDPITDHVPLVRDSKEGYRITQYDMKDLSELGLLKLDMLGLKTMDLIQYTIELIRDRRGINIDFQNIPTDDPNTYKTIASGRFVSVFQYDSAGMRAVAKQLMPDKFDHLVALNALYRPGPMLKEKGGQSIMDKYIERRHGRQAIETWHPELDSVFGGTLGLCIEENQLVTLADGTKKAIKDINIGDEVLSINSSINKVARKINTGTKECVTLHTETGRTLTLTKDHVLLVNGKEKAAGDVSTGDFIHMPYRSLNDTSDPGLTINQAYCIGLLLGDGSINASTPVMALGNDKLWREQVASAFKLAWPCLDPVEYHNQRSYYLSLRMGNPKTNGNRNALSSVLTTLGIRNTTCKNKFVPPDLLNNCDATRLAVLAGLWDSDGTVSNAVHFTSESNRLISDVKALLSHFHISHYQSKSGNRVYVRNVSRFMDLVPLRHHAKTSNDTRSCTHMRLHKSHLIEDFKSSGMESRGYAASKSIARSCLYNGRGTIGAITANKIDAELFNTYYINHDSERIVKVTNSGVCNVYDLTMTDSSRPWFVANDILVHNCLFQEQVMNLTKVMAGFSDLEADEYRAAIGKKDKEKFDAAQDKFIRRGVEYGRDPKMMAGLAKKLEGFARYGWNIGHSLAYSYLSYVTAWLETNYPHEYYCTLLNVNDDDSDQLGILLSNIIKNGTRIVPPDINKSKDTFTTDGANIYMSLYSILKLGESACSKILEERTTGGPYKDYLDFCIRVSKYPTVNKSVKENLIKGWAFDADRSMTDATKLMNTENIQTLIKKFKDKLSDDQIRDILEKSIIPAQIEFTEQERLQFEKEVLRFYITSHPLTPYQQMFSMFRNYNMVSPSDLQSINAGAKILMLGLVESKQMRTTKQGAPYMSLTVSDMIGSEYINIWSPLATQIEKQIVAGQLVLLSGAVVQDKLRPDQVQLKVNNAVGIIPGATGIPVKEYLAKDESVGNAAAAALGARVAAASRALTRSGHVFILSETSHLKPENYLNIKHISNQLHFTIDI